MSKRCLKYNGDSDYTLDQNSDSVWITVKGFSVYIKKTDEGVVCDIFEKGKESSYDSLASTYVFDSELEELE